MTLLLKLTLAPLLLGSVSLAGRYWGNHVAGWLAALPIIAAPIVLILTLEKGVTFGAMAASGTLLGILLLTNFCFIYAHFSKKLNTLTSIALSWLITFTLIFICKDISLPPVITFAIVYSGLIIALRFFPKHDKTAIDSTPSNWEIFVRMSSAATLVFAITSLANMLGPNLSGLLAPFPIASSVLAFFVHKYHGSNAAIKVLRGFVTGLFSFAMFFLVLALTLQAWGIAMAFATASVAALSTHAISARLSL